MKFPIFVSRKKLSVYWHVFWHLMRDVSNLFIRSLLMSVKSNQMIFKFRNQLKIIVYADVMTLRHELSTY